MNYPLDVEVCVKTFIEAGGCKDKSIKFLRKYITMLNEVYQVGLNNPVTDSMEEVFKLETCEVALKEFFKGSYGKFLIQAKDAYRQGQEDSVKNDARVLSQNVSSIS